MAKLICSLLIIGNCPFDHEDFIQDISVSCG